MNRTLYESIVAEQTRTPEKLVRLMGRIERNSAQVGECREWISRTNQDGYPTMNVWSGLRQRRVSVYVHVVVYLLHKPLQLPPSAVVEIDHLCEVRCCICLDHLRELTQTENVRRANWARAARRRQRMRLPLFDQREEL